MEDIVVLEWTYSPSDYFEETIHITHDKYEINIDGGKVQARIKPENYDKDHKMRDVLHDNLNARFLGAQLFTHRAYELSKASMYQLHSDGRKDYTLFAESCVMEMSLRTVDLIVKDKDGNVISDSRRERIEAKNRLSELTGKWCDKDPLVDYLLNIYSMSIKEPNNELVHLYEIREALSKRFAVEDAARKAIGVSNNKWRRLRQLANDENLRQGRHRGKSLGALRDATEEELKEARNIARNLVESYLEYLERQDQ
jgi:hypothetical protein